MAKFKIRIPYMLREIVFQLEQCLQLNLGVPMNAELPEQTDEPSEGVARVHFAGATFSVRLAMERGHYGLSLNISSVKGSVRCVPDGWIEKIQAQSGQTEYAHDNGKLKFEFAGKHWARLELNASNRRNDLPEYRWDDPDHPWIRWGQQTGNPDYPNLPE